MTDRELEMKLKRAVENTTPDVLDKIMMKCGNQEEDKSQNVDKEIGLNSNSFNKKKQSYGGWKKFAAMAAVFVLLIGGGVFGGMQYSLKQIASVILLDVNPSIEIQINKEEKVIKAYGLNPDGEEILKNMNLEGLDIYTAANAIVGSLLKHGYIDELANSILLSVEDEDTNRGGKLKESLTEEINAILEGASLNASILSQYVDGQSVEAVSEEYGISHGKAALIEQILKSNEKYTFEELAHLSVNELNLLVHNSHNQVEEVKTVGEAATSAYISEEEAKRIAYDHAGVKEQQVKETETELDYEYGTMIYEVDFLSGTMEYEYALDAVTGEILDYEAEADD